MEASKEETTLQGVTQHKERMQEEAKSLVSKNKSLNQVLECVFSRVVVARHRFKEVMDSLERDTGIESHGVKVETKAGGLKEAVAAARKAQEEGENKVLETVRKLALVEDELCRTHTRIKASQARKTKLEQEMRTVKESLKSVE